MISRILLSYLNEETEDSPAKVKGSLPLDSFPEDAKLILGPIRRYYANIKGEVSKGLELEYELTEFCSQDFKRLCRTYGLNRLDLLSDGVRGLKKEPSLDPEAHAQRSSMQEKISSMGKNSTGIRFSFSKKVIFKSLRSSVFDRFSSLAPSLVKHLENHKNSLIIPTIGMFRIDIK